jgi:Ca2+/H+ antiporter
MIVTGFTMLATVILTVKLMQSERVSVVMGVMSGIIMLGTSSYLGFFDFRGSNRDFSRNCFSDKEIIFGFRLLIEK